MQFIFVSFLTHRRMVQFRDHAFCRFFFASNMTWTRCEVSWDLDFEPFEKEAGSQWHWGLSVFGLEVIFFLPMPCALEAQTVIKTFCLWLAIPTYWRVGEKESKVSAETKEQNKQNTATKHKQKDNDPRHLAIESETLRFQKYPLVSQYCTTTK